MGVFGDRKDPTLLGLRQICKYTKNKIMLITQVRTDFTRVGYKRLDQSVSCDATITQYEEKKKKKANERFLQKVVATKLFEFLLQA